MDKIILLLYFLWSPVMVVVYTICMLMLSLAGPVCMYNNILFFISVINQLDA